MQTRELPLAETALRAYCAGIIDGEGYIGCTRTAPRGTNISYRYFVRLSVMMADREPVELVASLVGASVYQRDRKAKDNHSLMYVLDITSHVAIRLIRQVLPYLICKREQALLACQLQDLKTSNHAANGAGRRLTPEHLAKCDALYLAMRRRLVTNNGIEALPL